MDNIEGNRLHGLSIAVRKKRSRTSRRPRPDSQAFIETNDQSPLSSNSPSDDLSKVSSDENACFDANSKRKEFNLNQCVSQSFLGSENEGLQKKVKKDGGYSTLYNVDHVRIGSQYKRCSEGVLAPANWKSGSSSKLEDGLDSESRSVELYGGRNGENLNSGQSGVIKDGMGNENRVKKVKLKVGGVTRTIQANSSSIGASPSGLSAKSSRCDAAQPQVKQNFQGNSDDYHSPSDKRHGLQGIPWKDFSNGGFSLGKEDSLMGRVPGKNTSGKQGDKSEPVRKSKRVPKKRVLDDDFGDDDDDDEIRYLEKLKTSKVSTVYKEDDEESSKKHRKLSSVSSLDNVPLKLGKDLKKKARSDRLYEDADYEEDEESGSDVDVDGKKKQKQKKESVDSLMDNKREMTLTTRQRALQSKDSSAPGASLIEFPNGLPPAPPRKQKEKLSEVEQQLKKAEAAQRRRMQVEKAARESEAEAIRKILGQESSRKKREEKIKKRQEELAQERAANALILPPNSVRVLMGPSGTVVTFSEDMGLPSIFDSKSCSYPPPRENCVGPSCKNPYKYRDSKSKLPLCSLQCYKAIQEKMVAEAT